MCPRSQHRIVTTRCRSSKMGHPFTCLGVPIWNDTSGVFTEAQVPVPVRRAGQITGFIIRRQDGSCLYVVYRVESTCRLP
jgi:hypothetical protein